MESLKNTIYRLVADQKLSPKDATSLLSQIPENGQAASGDQIAIIGMAGRFPGARNLDQFWENLKKGVRSIGKFPPERQRDAESVLEDPSMAELLLGAPLTEVQKRDDLIATGGFLEEIDKFDAAFFRISPHEAKFMDPFQRLFLETSYEAIEDAGYGGERIYGSKTGVFVGRDHTNIPLYRFITEQDPMHLTGAWAGILASRFSYVFDLRGPSVVIDTACSSALTALHLACQSMKSGECEMAVAGGINVLAVALKIVNNAMDLLAIESADGIVRTFDKYANGTVWGEGVGAVLLKPLERAIADHDNIHAIIKASVINNDGASNGITAPNAGAQEELLLKAWKEAGINPDTIRYIEAHGTGTVLGDPIEIKAIANAFQKYTVKKQFCGIGSVKTNIGHLVGAAGVASLFKTILAIKHGEIPPSINFGDPNPYINFPESPVYVNDRLVKWEAEPFPRRAGVSAFGFSGTNNHVLLEEAPRVEELGEEPPGPHVFTISARNLRLFKDLVMKYQEFLSTGLKYRLSDLCYTTNMGRGHYGRRAAIIVKDYQDLMDKLRILQETNSAERPEQGIYFGEHKIITSHKKEREPGEITEGERRELTEAAAAKINEYFADTGQAESILGEVCDLYIRGAEVKWEEIYQGHNLRTVGLPVYPLERTRHWAGPRVIVPREEKSTFYEIGWVTQELIAKDQELGSGSYLIIHGPAKIEAEMITKLAEAGAEIYEVKIDQAFQCFNEHSYSIGGTGRDFQKLCEELGARDLRKIIYFLPEPGSSRKTGKLSDPPDFRENNVDILFYLAQAIAARPAGQTIEIILVAEELGEITGREEQLNPFHAATFGLGKVLPQEYPHLRCRCFDIDSVCAAEDLIREIGCGNSAYLVLYRNGRRYIEEFREVYLKNPKPPKLELLTKGVYLITGGTGGLGLEIGKYLATKGRINLGLFSRSGLPEQDQWDQILENNKDQKLCRKIKAVREIEATGATVQSYAVDLGSARDLKLVLDDLRKKYGRVNGIIHCAGVAGDGFLVRKEESVWREVLNPKIAGTCLLDQLTQEDRPDWMVLFSSITSLTGAPGQGDYTAANSFLDAYAFYRSKQGLRTLEINWPVWKETGMAVDYGVVNEDLLFKPLSTSQALRYFEEILSSDFIRVIPGELNYRFLAAVTDEFPIKLSGTIRDSLEKYRRAFQTSGRALERESAPVTIKGKGNQGYGEVEKKLAGIWAKVLGVTEIDIYENFHDLGGDSILATRLIEEIAGEYPGLISVTDLYAYPSVVQMAEYLEGKKAGPVVKRIVSGEGSANLSEQKIRGLLAGLKTGEMTVESALIAIIGMACRFPGARNVERYWNNIKNGVAAIGQFPARRLADLQLFDFEIGRVVAESGLPAGYLEEIDQFDASFFRISPKEARLMDPFQRLFLETAYETIEDAGYGGARMSHSRTGVYVGVDSSNKSQYMMMLDEPDLLAMTGSLTGILASRISYILDLKGPSLVVDTACSSGLVAVHQACLALKNKECEMALAGGINLLIFPQTGAGLTEIDTVDGKLRAFDRYATGTVWGEGAGAVLLKPLARAIADRDPIYAVIKGSAVNNDGASNGITAPNPEAQADVILRAWENAVVDPETIAYIETHGTGTILGDPIEIKGLTEAFRVYTEKRQFCGIGSVKTNIGHTVAVSGIASLIKAALALKNKTIPASLNFQEPNPYIQFSDSPVYINDRPRNWEREDSPRRAGVSAFGFSGTNCHLVLEEAPASVTQVEADHTRLEILTLSARSKNGLISLARNYLEYVTGEDGPDLRDFCYTANTGRGHYTCRLVVIFQDRLELGEKLSQVIRNGLTEDGEKGIYFGEHKVIPGFKELRGATELTEEEIRALNDTARMRMEQLPAAEKNYGEGLAELGRLYRAGAEIRWEDLYQGQTRRRINIPTYPLEPDRFWLEQGQIKRGFKGDHRQTGYPLLDQLMVNSLEQEIYVTEFSVAGHWVLADHTILNNHVVPGTTYLEMASEACRKYYPNSLRIDVVFMTPLVVDRNEVKEVQTIIKKAQGYLEFVIAGKSSSGNLLADEGWTIHAEGKVEPHEKFEAPDYDLSEIRKRCRERVELDLRADSGPFKFGPRWWNVQEVLFGEEEALIKLELLEELRNDLDYYQLHPSLMDNAVNALSQSIGEGMYLPLSYTGLKIFHPLPGKFYSYLRRKDPSDQSPETISFEIALIDGKGRVYAEIENYTIKKVHQAELKFKELSGKQNTYFETCWVPRNLTPTSPETSANRILVFKDEKGTAVRIISKLKEEGHRLIEVGIGADYRKIDENRYLIKGTAEDYHQLAADLKTEGVNRIFHLATISANKEINNLEALQEQLNRGVHSLYHLTRNLLANGFNQQIDLVLISEYASEVTGEEENINPHNAAFFGLGKVITQEYGQLKCRCIDLDNATGPDDLIPELFTKSPVFQVAYRKGIRYLELFRTAHLETRSCPPLKEGGLYLITGGTGGIGLEVGKYLANQAKVNLVLVNRSGMPERREWEKILLDGHDRVLCKKIRAIQEMEAAGARVICYLVDVSRTTEVELMFHELREEYGRINGIIHSAGIPGDGFLIRKDPALFQQVLAPKIFGTWLLNKGAAVDPPDFFVMFSSAITLTGAPGQGDYTAGNCYLDSFAAYRKKLGGHAVTINWPAWSETGMAVDNQYNDELDWFRLLGTEEALDIFGEIINANLTRVYVGELNWKVIGTTQGELPFLLSDEIKTILAGTRVEGKRDLPAARRTKKRTEVTFKGTPDQGYNETEQQLALIWAEVLDLKEIDPYENLHDLGGDSILATQLYKEIDRRYSGLINLSDIFTYPSIRQLAEKIDERRGQGPKKVKETDGFFDLKMEDLLDGIESGAITIQRGLEILAARRTGADE